MENSPTHGVLYLFVVLLLSNKTTGGCFPPSEEQGNSTVPWTFQIHPELFPPSENPTWLPKLILSYYSSHVWLPVDGQYYGADVTLDVYGFDLQPGQVSASAIWITDGSSHNSIEAGWHISPSLYKDSHTHFYTAWINGGPENACVNLNCPGFQKISSQIAPGDVINPVSSVHGQKRYMRLRVFKEKSSGNWYVRVYGVNGEFSNPVGYFPKYLVPELADKPVMIIFGGFVAHMKPQLSPPMGSGYVQASGNAASVNNVKLIDADGNDHMVTTHLGSFVDGKGCYNPSPVDPSARFFYGGPGCVD